MKTLEAPVKLTKAANNYLSDIYHCSSIAQIKPITMHTIIENVELTGDLIEKEIMDAYFALNSLSPLTSEQFYARKC